MLACGAMAYITRIRIEQCRNVRQLDIDLSVPVGENGAAQPAAAPAPRFRHLILTGPNGSGKSGVLQEVAAHVEMWLYPQMDGWRPPTRSVEVEWNTEANPNLIDLAERGDVIGVYLPARRRIHHQEVAGPSKLDWEPGRLRPTTEASERLLQFLVNKRTEMALAAEDGDTTTVERIRDWFVAFEGLLRRLMEDDGLTLEFDRRAFDFRFRRSDGYIFDINALADGHAALLSILAELLIRVDVLRAARGDVTLEPEGVVIVDEIETHLHLSLQEQVLPFLTGLFPRLQFLVATHSPAVISSIPNAIVYDLRQREATLSDDLWGVRYGMLMTEHFGISSDLDLDSTQKLVRARLLAKMPTRTHAEEEELSALSTALVTRSPALAVELWALEEGIGAASASTGARK